MGICTAFGTIGQGTHVQRLCLGSLLVYQAWKERGNPGLGVHDKKRPLRCERACDNLFLYCTSKCRTMSDLESLQARLHYSFKNASLLEEALTAAGAAASSRNVDGPVSGNKRLALIGDAVLCLSVLDEWYPGGCSTGKSEMAHRARLDAMHD